MAAKAGFASKSAEGSIFETVLKWKEIFASGGNEDQKSAVMAVLQDQATQDGRRLAMLYETAPDDFRKIYQGIRSFLDVD